MKKYFLFIALFTVLFSTNSRSQGEAALPFLLVNPDPQSIAYGWGGASNVSTAPFGYYYNPALLGYYSQNTTFAYQTYAEVASWLPAFDTDWRVNNNSFVVGYNHRNLIKNLSVSAGFGYSHYRFSHGYYRYYDPVTSSFGDLLAVYDEYDAYTFGINLDYFVNLSFGMAFKNVTSVLGSFNGQGKASVKAKDWGLLLDIPVLKLIDKDLLITQGDINLKPFMNFTIGYSRLNSGNEIYYFDPVQIDPIPLTAHLGYNVSFGTDIKVFDSYIRLIDLNFMIDAEDILVSHDIDGLSYQSGLGDIDITENLLNWKATDKNIVRKGRSITVFETVSFMGGSFFGPGYRDGRRTSGVMLSSGGITKLILSGLGEINPFVGYLLSHLEIKYVDATTFKGDAFNTNLSSVTVAFGRISL